MLTAFVFLILHPKRAEILKRFCLLQGLVFLLRTMTITVRTCSTRWIQYISEIHSFGVYFSIFLSLFECIFWILQVTLLPNPYKNCKVRSQSSTLETSVFLEAFLILHGFRKNTCSDVFFSGHAANVTLLCLVWLFYTDTIFLYEKFYKIFRTTSGCSPLVSSVILQTTLKTSVFLVKLAVVLVAFNIYYVIVATRFHYTVDVLMGIFIASSFWTIYFLSLHLLHSKRVWFLSWYETTLVTSGEDRSRFGISEDDSTRSGTPELQKHTPNEWTRCFLNYIHLIISSFDMVVFSLEVSIASYESNTAVSFHSFVLVQYDCKFP